MVDGASSSPTSRSRQADVSETDQDVAQNAGARAAKIDSDPTESLEEARRAAEGKAPNASGGTAPSDSEVHVPGTSDANATDIPSANMPGR